MSRNAILRFIELARVVARREHRACEHTRVPLTSRSDPGALLCVTFGVSPPWPLQDILLLRAEPRSIRNAFSRAGYCRLTAPSTDGRIASACRH